MTDYLRRLGDELERAISEQKDVRAPRSGVLIALVAFFAVIALALPVWMWRYSGGASPNATDASPRAGAEVAVGVDSMRSLPILWARVQHSSALAGTAGSLHLTSAASGPDGFLAVGWESQEATPRAVLLRSVDGVSWAREPLDLPAGTLLQDVAIGPQGAVLAGVEGTEAVVYWSTPDGSWVRSRIDPDAGRMSSVVNAVRATPDEFVAVGRTDDQRGGSRAAVWRSSDGRSWTRLDDQAFQGPDSAATDSVETGDTVVVGGVWSDGISPAQPVVWRGTARGTRWDRIPLPTRDTSMLGGVAAAAARPRDVVAVGFEGDSGAIWRSTNGGAWERAEGDFGDDPSIVRIHDVVAGPAGYVAVGSVSDGMERNRMVLWFSPNGRSWTRQDVEQPLSVVGGNVIPARLAAGRESVIAVGSEFEPLGKSVGAVWISPPRGGTEQLLVYQPPAEQRATIAVNPPQAVEESVVTVEVSTEARAPVSVAIGDTSVCLAEGAGATKRCTFRPVDVGIGVGVYEIAADVGVATSFEVLPRGSIVMALDAIYQPTTWPLVFAVLVRNQSALDLDLSGWVIEDADGDRFTFPAGTLLPAAATATVSQSGTLGSPCPPDQGLSFHLCNAFGSDVIDESVQIWGGNELVLRDPDGQAVASWSP
ncbi:MAG TPA: hypothetical protein ENK55_01655 [Actinobacteria bacterium]|nr:hypothetical protein [Actinomycetota bacterium]